MKSSLLNSIGKNLMKIKVKGGQHAPTIGIIVGSIGVIVGTVMACKATLDLNETLENAKNDIDDIHAEFEEIKEANAEDEEAATKAVSEVNKKITNVYARTALDLVKLYGPSVLVLGLSITTIAFSHKTMLKRNASLIAANGSLYAAFKDYRKRVAEKYGDEAEKDILYNVRDEVEETVDPETGEIKETKTGKKTMTIDKNISRFAKFYDETCTGWTKNPEHNLTYLKMVEHDLNKKLKYGKDHFVVLNDLYDALGLPRTEDGFKYGWIYDEENPNGDNYIDLGIYDYNSDASRRFVNGYENVILIDPNVDGYILNKI